MLDSLFAVGCDVRENRCSINPLAALTIKNGIHHMPPFSIAFHSNSALCTASLRIEASPVAKFLILIELSLTAVEAPY